MNRRKESATNCSKSHTNGSGEMKRWQENVNTITHLYQSRQRRNYLLGCMRSRYRLRVRLKISSIPRSSTITHLGRCTLRYGVYPHPGRPERHGRDLCLNVSRRSFLRNVVPKMCVKHCVGLDPVSLRYTLLTSLAKTVLTTHHTAQRRGTPVQTSCSDSKSNIQVT